MVVARVSLTGPTELHQALKVNADRWIEAEIERASLEFDNLWLEQVIVTTRTAGADRPADGDALSEIERTVEAYVQAQKAVPAADPEPPMKKLVPAVALVFAVIDSAVAVAAFLTTHAAACQNPNC
jgi:hypothetical protein